MSVQTEWRGMLRPPCYTVLTAGAVFFSGFLFLDLSWFQDFEIVASP